MVLMLAGCVRLDRFLGEHQEGLVGVNAGAWGEDPDLEDIYKVLFCLLDMQCV